jgi:hypothetical protein
MLRPAFIGRRTINGKRCWYKVGHDAASINSTYSLHYILPYNVCVSILYYLSIYVAGVEPSPLILRPFIGLFYQPWVMDGDDCAAISGMNEWQEKPKYSEETCPSAALSTTDPS